MARPSKLFPNHNGPETPRRVVGGLIDERENRVRRRRLPAFMRRLVKEKGTVVPSGALEPASAHWGESTAETPLERAGLCKSPAK